MLEAYIIPQWYKEMHDRENITQDSDDPPFIKYPEITQEDEAAYRTKEAWLENTQLQRDDLHDACAYIGIDNPSVLRMPGMRLSEALYFWQRSGVKAMHEMINGPNGGALLADEVGSGKTAVTGGVSQHVSITHSVRDQS